MIITRLRIAPIELPLAAPLITARGPLHSRMLVLLMMHDDAGRVAVAEAAPLPGHGTESIDITLALLSQLAVRAEFPPLDPQLESFGPWLAALGLARDFAPAACWACECALAALAAAQARQSLDESLGATTSQVQVNALIGSGAPHEVLHAAQRALAAGFRTLKLKVGVRPLREEIALVRQIRQAFPEAILRADANGAWRRDEARQFGHAVTSCELEYIEDPLREPTPANLRELRAATPGPIALDEPLVDEEYYTVALAKRLCDVAVLKPAAIGSWSRLAQMAAAAHARGMDVVISNLLESSLGLVYATIAAAAFGSASLAHGLGTASLLRQDTLTPPLLPLSGAIPVPDPRELPSRLVPDMFSRLSDA